MALRRTMTFVEEGGSNEIVEEGGSNEIVEEEGNNENLFPIIIPMIIPSCVMRKEKARWNPSTSLAAKQMALGSLQVRLFILEEGRLQGGAN